MWVVKGLYSALTMYYVTTYMSSYAVTIFNSSKSKYNTLNTIIGTIVTAILFWMQNSNITENKK